MTIKFIKGYAVKDSRAGTPQEERYKEGEIVSGLEPESEQHFIDRGVAEYAEGKSTEEPPKTAKTGTVIVDSTTTVPAKQK